MAWFARGPVGCGLVVADLPVLARVEVAHEDGHVRVRELEGELLQSLPVAGRCAIVW